MFFFLVGGLGNVPERKTRCKGGHQKVSFCTVHNGSLYFFVYFWSLVFMKTCFTQSMVQVHTHYHHSHSAFLHFHHVSPTMTVSSPSLSESLSEMGLLACKRYCLVTVIVINACPLTTFRRLVLSLSFCFLTSSMEKGVWSSVNLKTKGFQPSS